MSQKKDDYYDNINNLSNADYSMIMLKAKTKYDMLLSNKDRPFGSPSDEEQHVIALQLNEVKDSNLKLLKQPKTKLKPHTSSSKSNSSATTQKTKHSKNSSDRKWQKQDEAWKKIAPNPRESNTKKQYNKTWFWCIHHLAWCLHRPDDCRKGKDLANRTLIQQPNKHGKSRQVPSCTLS
jgi:hypothetical protein